MADPFFSYLSFLMSELLHGKIDTHAHTQQQRKGESK